MNLNIAVITLLLSLYFTSCSERKKLCECHPIENLGEQNTTTASRQGHDIKSKLDIGAEAKIREIINVNFGIGVNYEDYDTVLKTTTIKIIDSYPDITNLQRFELDFYCRYVAIICQNESFDNAKISELKATKLQTIHQLLEGLLLEKIRIKKTDHISNTHPESEFTSKNNKEPLFINIKTVNDIIEAEGTCIIDNKKYSDEEQAIEMAKICAETYAKAKLIEKINGIIIKQIIKIEDQTTVRAEIEGKVEGLIKGTFQVGEVKISKNKLTLKLAVNKMDVENIKKEVESMLNVKN